MAVASGEPSQLFTETKWGDNAVHLKDFAGKHSLPNVLKITKGQYRNVGVAKNVHSELYIHSIRTSKKVLAEGIKLRDGRRGIQTIDQKFSLPLSYQGWFELLSEDGKPIKAILSVQELVKVFPHRFLVRENIKGYVPKENGELTVEKSRVVHTGEQLGLVGEVAAPFTTTKGIFSKRILKCMDMKEEPVFFLFEQKGLFSPIAGTANISGVHNIKGLLEKFRMPIMVRLVHGIIPTRMDKNSFTGVFRLLSLYTDETAFVCPLKREAKMVPISTREPLKVASASNLDSIRDLEDMKYFHQRCTKMIASYNNSIHIMINMPDPQDLEKGKREMLQLERERQKQVQQTRPANGRNAEEDIIFQEVDDIYQYVRDGGPPPPPRPRPSQSNGATSGWPLTKKQPKQPDAKKDKKAGHPKKSPAVKTVPSPPAEDRSQDEDYWEEPIYDDIDKFQRRKDEDSPIFPGDAFSLPHEEKQASKPSNFASKLAKFANLGSKEDKTGAKDIPNQKPGTRNKHRNVNGERYKSSDSLNKLSDSPKESKPKQDVVEYVSNLREAYKNRPEEDRERENPGAGSRPGSIAERLQGSSEEDIVENSKGAAANNAPRIPPKRFDLNQHDSSESLPSPASRSSAGSPPVTDDSKPAEVRVIPNRNVVSVSSPVSSKHGAGGGQPLPLNGKVNIILPAQASHKNGALPTSPVSVASTTAPNMTFNRATNQISISTPTHVNNRPMSLQHQRYVAVARVGPEGESQRDNNINDKFRHNSRKMQSMHL